jgi:Cu+-exporting ATPase
MSSHEHGHEEHKGHTGHEGHEGHRVTVGKAEGTIYTCPMHPQIRKPAPGHCPICGMALEPVMPTLDEGENAELTDFRRRFWWTLPLTIVVVVLAMGGHLLFPG